MAIKIHTARVSQSALSQLSLYALLASAEPAPSKAHFLVELLTSFELVGPNGQHTCFVFEVMGPNLSDMVRSQEFQVGHPFDDDFCHRFPKHLAKRILEETLHGLHFLHRNKVVHGDVHKGNILVNFLLPQYTADALKNLRQSADQARPLERLDGKKDLWAPPYLLPSASLRSYVSTELGPFTKLTDIGEAFRCGKVPKKIATPDYLRAPETILKLTNTIGTSIDIWSFGCLAFELLTGSTLFMVSKMFADGETLDDAHLIQLTEVIGPLPEQIFRAWRRGSCYFDASFRRTYNPEGDESLEGDLSSDNEAWKSEDRLFVSDDSESIFLEDDAVTSNSEDELARVRLNKPLEETFRQKKPKDIDEIEEKQILHLLRWMFQYNPAERPSAEEILRHEWFQTQSDACTSPLRENFKDN